MQKNIIDEINLIKTREVLDLNCNATLIITVVNPGQIDLTTDKIQISNNLTSNFKDLSNRRIKITGSVEANADKNDMFFNVLSSEIVNDKIILTVNTQYYIQRQIAEVPEVTIPAVPPETEPTIIPSIPAHFVVEGSLNLFIERDIQLETELNSMIDALSVPNANTLTRADIATCNDFFAKNELMCTTLLQHVSAYKDENLFNTRLGVINDFMKKDISLYNRIQVLNFKTDITQTISLVNQLHSDVAKYYDDIKKLIVKFKLSDLKISGKQTEEMIETRSAQDKADLGTYYQYYLDNGKDEYNKLKDTTFDSIKIQ